MPDERTPDRPEFTLAFEPDTGDGGALDCLLDVGLMAAFTPDATPMPDGRVPAAGGTTLGVPQAVGRYDLGGVIARGGMGEVYRGRDASLGREVAVKVLRPEQRGNAAAVHRFVEEAQIGSQLQHPGIVPVYDVRQFPDGRPYFAMKLVLGRTLAALLADRPDAAVIDALEWTARARQAATRPRGSGRTRRRRGFAGC